MDKGFNWHGDVQDKAYYAVVCDHLERWEEPVETGVTMALNILHAAHDEFREPTEVRMAQQYLTDFTSLVEGEGGG